MLVLPTITIPPNPAPAVISAEMWRFRTYCLWLEPGSQDVDSGIYADKPGYHNKRNSLPSTDYSVRLPPDKEGPADKAAAFDWTFRTAQGGNYSRIIFYSDRIEAAFNRRDPRLYGFREVLCQADTDLQAEGFDFVSWTRRTPDDSHLWHMHFSKLRKYINDRQSYDAMLSILIGQSLAEWEEDEDMTPDQSKKLSDLHHVAVSRGKTTDGKWFTPGLESKLDTVLANLALLNGKDFVDEAAIVSAILGGLGTKDVEDIADALRSTIDAEKLAALKAIL
jgi:hypothetical protein